MKRAFYIICVLLLGLAPTTSHAGDSGDAGALFLRVGMGARASAMGEAFVGVAKDASTVYWNPAAMAAVLGTNVLFMHNEYFQSIRFEQAALTHETDYGTVGLSFSGMYLDEMDRYDNVPSAVPLGTFSAYDVAFSLGFARYVIPNVSVGATVRSIYEKIDETSAKGLAFDVGVYHVSRVPGVKFAAMMANIGSPMKFETDTFTGEEFALPRVFKIGGSYERDLEQLRGDLLLTLDVLFPNDGDIKQHVGIEYGYLKQVFARGGFKAGYDSQGATFGLGVKYKKLLFDYAVLFVSNDLGDSHRVSLAFRI